MSDQHMTCFSLKRTTLLLIVILLNSFADNQHSDEEFRWQDASKEVDSLPFKQFFIDSLKNAYSIIPQSSLRDLAKTPLCKNETLVYQVTWGPVIAGNVILTSTFDSSTNTIQVGGKALSNNFVGAFYKMRDYVITTIDASGLYPLFFQQHLREGKRYKNDGWIIYDALNNKIHVKEKDAKSIETPKFTYDYISVLYFIRNLKPVPGDTFTLNIFVNSKVHPMFFKCKEKQTINTDFGKINCLLIEPRLMGDGQSFNQRDKLELWLSDDSIPTPVLIKSKIKVGSVCAKLIWHNHTSPHLTRTVG